MTQKQQTELLNSLLKKAENHEMTEQEIEAQAISFAIGTSGKRNKMTHEQVRALIHKGRGIAHDHK